MTVMHARAKRPGMMPSPADERPAASSPRLTGKARKSGHRAIETGALASVARRSVRVDQDEQRVPVAVIADLLHVLHVAGSGTLVPELLPRAAPEPRQLRIKRAAQRL